MLRYSRPGDEAGLSAIWKTVFGDGDDYISGFLSHMYEPGKAVCAVEDGVTVSMAFALELGTLRVPGQAGVPCGYVYSVATLPEWRGRGLAGRMTVAAAELCERHGGVAAVCPAEPSLFDYYRQNGEFEDFFYICERRFSLPDSARSGGKTVRLSAEEYSKEREKLLSERSHIELSPRAAEYQEYLCLRSGGGFFGLPDGAVFAAERAGDTVFIKELLGGDSGSEINAAASLPASAYIVRTPDGSGTTVRKFAMLRDAKRFLGAAGGRPWLGFAFD